jgi:hypothetical protein
MKYVKLAFYSLAIFFITWGIVSFFGPIFMQDGDKKKMIFRPLSYYEDLSSNIGIIAGLIITGYFLYTFTKAKN